MTHRIRRLTCVALLAAQFLAGCTSWQVVDVSPRTLAGDPHIKRIRVLEKGGTTTYLDAPAVSGDSLTGKVTLRTAANTGVPFTAGTMLGIPLSMVDQVAVRRANGLKTVGFVAGVTALTVAGAAAALVMFPPSLGWGGGGSGGYSCCSAGW